VIDISALGDRLSLRLGVLCDHALIGQDGKLSLIGIFDHIGVTQLPAQHPRFFVVVVLQGSAVEPQVEMELISPNGTTMMHEAIPIDPMAISQGSGNLIAEVNMLSLDQPGTFQFRLSGGGRVLGVVPLHVDLVSAEQSAPDPASIPRA
jgi:hypothetical protein